MKLVLAALLFLSPFALSSPWYEIENSAQRLEQVIKLELNAEGAVSEYIPGYGLYISILQPAPKDFTELSFSELSELAAPVEAGRPTREVRESLKSIMNDLSVLVKGLDSEEWVSVRHYNEGDTILVRLKPSVPDSMESWENGKLVGR